MSKTKTSQHSRAHDAPHGLGEVHQVRGGEEDLGADETLVLVET